MASILAISASRSKFPIKGLFGICAIKASGVTAGATAGAATGSTACAGILKLPRLKFPKLPRSKLPILSCKSASCSGLSVIAGLAAGAVLLASTFALISSMRACISGPIRGENLR